MGLVAREIEEAGIATVALSMIPALTVATGAPRVAGIAYPMGRPMGAPGDAEGQRAVLRAALDVLGMERMPDSVTLPFSWPGSVRQARLGPSEPPPIAQLIKRKPWLFFRLMSGDIPRQPFEATAQAR